MLIPLFAHDIPIRSLRMLIAVVTLVALVCLSWLVWFHTVSKVAGKTFFVMGPPFSGKSKAKLLAKLLKLKYIGTGDLLRMTQKLLKEDCTEEEKHQAITLLLSILNMVKPDLSMISLEVTNQHAKRLSIDHHMHHPTIALAIVIGQTMKEGGLIEDSWIAALYNAQKSICRNGMIVDGIPRSIAQLDMVELPHGIIFFHLHRVELLIRAGKRAAEDPGRNDNRCDVFVKRIKDWDDIEDKIIAHYAMKQVPIRIVSSKGSFYWGVLKTFWAFASI